MTDNPKNSIREEAKRHRDRLDNDPAAPEAAARLFIEAFDPQPGHKISLYWPKGREFATLPLIDALIERGCICLLPRMVKDSRILEFHSWDGQSDLIAGDMGILQPAPTQAERPDIVVVPLLAFDRRGHRLGYGRGYYDATLDELRKGHKIKAVGWAYAEQAVLFNLPADQYDQTLDYVITQNAVHSFGT